MENNKKDIKFDKMATEYDEGFEPALQNAGSFWGLLIIIHCFFSNYISRLSPFKRKYANH